jgi:hypothetical protein
MASGENGRMQQRQPSETQTVGLAIESGCARLAQVSLTFGLDLAILVERNLVH